MQKTRQCVSRAVATLKFPERTRGSHLARDPTGEREVQSSRRGKAQAAPVAHKRPSDPGMKRDWKVKLA